MVTTRFSVAVHVLLLLAAPEAHTKATSGLIAKSVKTNPVVIRRITRRLAQAGLVRVRRGPGGAALARTPAEISLADVWRATKTGSDAPLLAVHAGAEQRTTNNGEIRTVLTAAFRLAEEAMEQALGRTTIANLLTTIDERGSVARLD